MEIQQSQGQGKNLYEGDIASNYYEGMEKVVEEPFFKDWLRLTKSLPNISTANVLDAGCGNGKYTRPFRDLTTGKIYGADISEEMLKMANEQEAELASKSGPEFHRIQYEKADATADICKALGVTEGFFDVINACWLVLHCDSVEMLSSMIKALGNSLKPGGVMIGMTLSPDMTPEFVKKTQGKGVSIERKDFEIPLYDAELLISKFSDEKGNVMWDTHDHFYKRETYLKAFKEGGFSQVEFIAFEKSKGKDGEFTNDNVIEEGGTLFRATK